MDTTPYPETARIGKLPLSRPAPWGRPKEENIRRSTRTRPPLVLALLALAMLAAAGCVGISNPEGWAGPAVAGDLIVASTDKGKLSALDTEDFSVLWTFPTGDEEPEIDLQAIYATPIVIGDTVYVGAYSKDVYALRLEDGGVVWSLKVDGQIVAGLAAGEGVIYVATVEGTLLALDAADGSERRRFDAGESIWAAPLLADGVIYVASVNGKLYALEADTFDAIWEAPFKSEHGLISDPVLADDTILDGGIGRALHAIDAGNGRERWSFKTDNWFWGRPLAVNGTVYAPNLDGKLYALSLADGTPVWDSPFEAEEPLRSSPVLAGDTLIITDRDGNVYGLDPTTGEPMPWSPKATGETLLSDPLVLAEQETDVEKVFISAEGGDLFRLEDATTGSLSRLDPATGRFVEVVTTP